MFGLPLIPKAKADMAPFNPSRSWLLGERPTFAFTLASAVTAGYVVAGAGYLANSGWWPAAMITASALSLVTLTLFASKYFIVGFPISIAIAVWASCAAT